MGQLWCTATISYGAFGRPEGASRRYVHQITRFQGFQQPKINQEGPACDNVWTLYDSHIYLYISCHRCQQWWSEPVSEDWLASCARFLFKGISYIYIRIFTHVFKKEKTTSMHFFRRRPMIMIWLDLAVTGLQLLYLHGPGSNNAMSQKQVQAVFKWLGVDMFTPARGVCSSKLRNLKWVVDFHLLEWHYLEGTINHKLEAWQLQSMISHDPWLILMYSIGLVWTQHLQQEKPQDCIIRLCLTLKACQSVSWWCSFGKGAAWNIWCWLIFVQVWPWQQRGIT